MRLVGDRLITSGARSLEGFVKGVMGGLLALVLTWVAQTLINRYVIQTISSRRGLHARVAVRRADRAVGERVSVRRHHAACDRRVAPLPGWRWALEAIRRARRPAGGSPRRRDPGAARGPRAHPGERAELERRMSSIPGERARAARGGVQPRPAAQATERVIQTLDRQLAAITTDVDETTRRTRAAERELGMRRRWSAGSWTSTSADHSTRPRPC